MKNNWWIYIVLLIGGAIVSSVIEHYVDKALDKKENGKLEKHN